MKKMTALWSARNLRQGEKIYARTMPQIHEEDLFCFPTREGSILCVGRIAGFGIDSEWDSLVTIRYACPLSKKVLTRHVTERDHEWFNCFFVER